MTLFETLDTIVTLALLGVFLWLYYRWTTGLVRAHGQIYGPRDPRQRHIVQLLPPGPAEDGPQAVAYRQVFWRMSLRFFGLSIAIWTAIYGLHLLRTWQ
ncbi:hypothetical protein [Jannaschia donghaensis]|uniref:Uncharacterized protein n=1 Tax=Jannaschia donghaensis TaxID=420998 RepID=A0A0M6YJK5_9RHOB|nr:hypothetical protein [Jannaschia donghaensis]CTQ50542.1 hypothetical protein JDO7802_02566 [Jannaschia donghaensis]